jgi:hypothetical protein
MQEYVNKYGKTALYVIGGLIVMYLMIYVFTPKQEIPLEYKHALDSLNRLSTDLLTKQKELEKVIGQHELELHSLDDKIGNIKEKTTIVREYYHEISGKAGKFTPTQVDSFFKARYNY